jgi:hypothetical protein
MKDRLESRVRRTGMMMKAYPRGFKLKSCVGQTDDFEMYVGPHVIFSNIKLSVLFKIENNIKIGRLHHYLLSSILIRAFLTFLKFLKFGVRLTFDGV